MKNFFRYLAVGFLPGALFGDAEPYYTPSLPEPAQYSTLPWLTGPLLTPSENVIPPGSWNIEPFFYFNTQYGQYNKNWQSTSLPHNVYSFLSSTPIQYGLFPSFDFQIVPAFSWNHTDHTSQWTFNDLGIILDFQLLHYQKERWWPNIKFVLQGTVPCGKYQHLDPNKKGTDKGGNGAINTRAGISLGRIFQLSQFHFFRARGFIGYTLPNPVHVKGLNAYGGDKGTRGKSYPAQSLIGQVGLEYTLSAHWVVACDVQYLHTTTQRFRGVTTQSMKAPSSEQWSLAPALEYNWSTHYGIISGVWFTPAGRNSPAFANWTTAVNFYF